ncbi:Vacuolar protein sorting/targeting protein 10 [Neolecta irregularis DAH-3]|uniref:Vacuolar protein sorting/targeting protein 10 n=1 Tax=Neolecta irregularis (strain DAH-3) TaxID=1198029 RepID=A0A1U7LHI8_NEOID|nr:Vacuolar protein sorting/targeting protein 10 [Neolecta irregularis DAH-3]|eukprot:OLL21991.1 Vacuolar protein sorting/targeting protein 10 [Neolecta irregularis DAH-3]
MLLRGWFALPSFTFLFAIYYPTFAHDPKISKTEFDNLPSGYVYLDDSSVIFYHDGVMRNVYYSTDEGSSWDRVKGVPEGEAISFYEHPNDNKMAFILGPSHTHYKTTDQGKSWSKWTTEVLPSLTMPLVFNAEKPEYILFLGETCKPDSSWFGESCRDSVYYTQNSFSSDPKLMLENVGSCTFAQTSKDFKKASAESVFCIQQDQNSNDQYPENQRLVSSDNWFVDMTEIKGDNGRVLRGLIGIGSVQKFLVAASKSSGTDEMALYVSDDGIIWDKAEFPNNHAGIFEDAFTILQSRPFSIQVDVASGSYYHSTGTFFKSNSNGTYFSKSLDHTNRNNMGLADFEQIQNIEGIILMNVVDNWKEIEENKHAEKDLQSRISFDDGNTWQSLRVTESTKNKECSEKSPCDLHLWSVTALKNTGTIFSSPAPGIVMGVGSIGKVLLPYEKCDLFVSSDAGETWRLARPGAHKVSLDLGTSIQPKILTTVPDSTSTKFTLLGSVGAKTFVLAIDFDGVVDRKCKLNEKHPKDGDFEKWYARVIDGQPKCLMGHKQYFWRKKADSNCYVGEKYKDPVPEEEDCPCTDDDYECDYNFIKNFEGKCASVGPEPVKKGQCKNPGDKYLGFSGYRKIPGNTCNSKKGITKDDPTVILQTNRNEIYLSHDHGGTWEQVLKDEEVVAMIPHIYFKDWVFFQTAKHVYYSKNRGKRIEKMNIPGPPNILSIDLFSFHPKHKDWLIYTAGKNCADSEKKCRAVAHYTKDAGNTWKELNDYIRNCMWRQDSRYQTEEALVFCEKYEKDDPQTRNNPLNLISTVDFFKETNEHLKDIVGFALFEEFVVAAEVDKGTDLLKMQISIDGKTFAQARFPPDFTMGNGQAYTILDSVTNSIFMHVTTSSRLGSEWGVILKSNSNGTDYVVSLDSVNRDEKGYVDFEKMQGIEGVAVVNVVMNTADAVGGAKKKLKTMITHNDGGEWTFLTPPKKDAQGNSFECSGGLEKCSLNLHGYTERKDERDTYSSGSAVGLMMGVGNVGESLSAYLDGDTFLTRDGGMTWSQVHKGAYTWEYGDQGAIIVIVIDDKPTDSVLYTLDEGKSWTEYKFNQDKVNVVDISTLPSDTSRKFLLFTRASGQDNFGTVQLDFTGLTDKQCSLKPDNPDDDDFELWTPGHPSNEDKCLFGHQIQYNRKIPDHLCYIGPKIAQPHTILKDCACSRQDFECDYNYRRASDGSCELAPGAQPPDHQELCKTNKSTVEWYEPTGYRKIPLSTCVGGKQLDKSSSHPCPGKEQEYKEGRKGLSGFAFFWIFTCCIATAFGTGWWFWNRSHGKFGRIRLGEERDPPGYIRVPIIVISAVIAVVAALPLIAQSVYSWGRAKVTGQRSVLPTDEDSGLFGDEEDEEDDV